jgi:hypothetical protein
LGPVASTLTTSPPRATYVSFSLLEMGRPIQRNVLSKDAKLSLSAPWRHTGPADVCVAALVLTVGPTWRQVVNFTPRPVYSRKESLYQLNVRLVWPQNQSGRFKDKLSFLSRDTNPRLSGS